MYRVTPELLKFIKRRAGLNEASSKTVTGHRIPAVKYRVVELATDGAFLLQHIHHGSKTATATISRDGEVLQFTVGLCGYDTKTTWDYLKEFLAGLHPEFYVERRNVRLPRGMFVPVGRQPVGAPGYAGGHFATPGYRYAMSICVGVRDRQYREELIDARSDVRITVDPRNGTTEASRVPTLPLMRSLPVCAEDRAIRKQLEGLEGLARVAEPKLWHSVFPGDFKCYGSLNYDAAAEVYDAVKSGELEIEHAMARLKGCVAWPVETEVVESAVSLTQIERATRAERLGKTKRAVRVSA